MAVGSYCNQLGARTRHLCWPGDYTVIVRLLTIKWRWEVQVVSEMTAVVLVLLLLLLMRR
jgi:hypothetical protein